LPDDPDPKPRLISQAVGLFVVEPDETEWQSGVRHLRKRQHPHAKNQQRAPHRSRESTPLACQK
jgi:hypothetical protein